MLNRYCVAAVLVLGAGVSAGGSDLRALKFTSVAVPGARITEAADINNLGQIVGSWIGPDDDGGHGFLLSSGVYTPITFPGALATVATGINDAGDVIGSYYLADANNTITEVHGYLLTAGNHFTTITFPGKRVTQAFGINNLGDIVGAYVDIVDEQVSGVHGFLLRNGTFTTINLPKPTANPMVTFALDINDSGDIVGGYNDDDVFQTRRGYVLRDGEFTTFDVPGSTMTDLFGTNNAGEMVGVYQDARDGQFYSFVFSPKRGVSRLSATGSPKQRLTIIAAHGINDLGDVVGSAFDGSAVCGFHASSPRRP